MFFNPSFTLESLRELHSCLAPSSLNEVDFLEVGPRYLYVFQNFRYTNKVMLAVCQLTCFDGAADFRKEFSPGRESGLHSIIYNNSLNSGLTYSLPQL